MSTINICAICREESDILYQCCPNKSNSLCESCWNKLISSIINEGQLSLLFDRKLTCQFCDKPIEHERLPTDIQSQLKNILLTIPKSKNPKFIEEFNYSYNKSNELRHCLTNERFIYLSQRHCYLLGSCIDTYIQSLMKNNQWNYNEIWLPIKDKDTNDHHDQVNIFTSNDFYTNDNGCLILIQGSGVVRPGQWARSCCLNESLDIGSMFPYMTKAKEHNLSVIILNPNQTSYIDEKPFDSKYTNFDNKKDSFAEGEGTASGDTEAKSVVNQENLPNDELISFYLSSNSLPSPSTKQIPNLSTNRQHALYVYDNIISKSPAKNFYYVAHSAGGDCLMYLLRERENNILSIPTKIAFTDSGHSRLPLESRKIKNFLKINGIHFVASDKPMGTTINKVYRFPRRPTCQEVSAGHPRHEYTSGYCVQGVFQFFFPLK